MIQLKTPSVYLHQKGALEAAGPVLAALGSQALIVGGKTALARAESRLHDGLRAADITAETRAVPSICSQANIARVSEAAAQTHAQFLIGVGGGSIHDTVKAAGVRTGLPVANVPTVAATCASWSAVAVVYDDLHRVTEMRELPVSPYAVIADEDILSAAPVRYFHAGIADTLVKWYEFSPLRARCGEKFALRVRLDNARAALSLLEPFLDGAPANGGSFSDAIDAILFLAGFSGSMREAGYGASVAHSLHNSMTWLPETHGSLHGEIVIFSLLAQFVLEGKAESEITAFIRRLLPLGLPVTLAQLGIHENMEEKIRQIIGHLVFPDVAAKSLPFSLAGADIAHALREADRLGRQTLAGVRRTAAQG